MNPRFSLLQKAAISLTVLLAAICVTTSVHPDALVAGFVETDLVSDLPGVAAHRDTRLVNPWGLTRSATGPWWVANQGTGLGTVYNGSGMTSSFAVIVPPPMGKSGPSTPTGVVFNGGSSFMVSKGGKSGPAQYIFATEDGTLSGWNPTVDATHAILTVDRSATAVYKGLTGIDGFLFAANLKQSRIDVFDSGFHFRGAFVDHSIPAGFGPFNVRAFDGVIVVTYAMQDADKEDEVPGPGRGFVTVLDPFRGTMGRFASHGALDAPWGLALAPAGFGPLSGALLVGNFGDGRINAYNPRTGAFLGPLKDRTGSVIAIEGLWALRFGNGGQAGPANALFFTAGIDDEAHGLFGSLRFVP